MLDLGAGQFERIINYRAEGWAVGLDNENPALIDIFIDDVLVGQTLADRYREDLKTEFIRGGYAHFAFGIPLRFADGQQHSIHLINRALGTALENSPQSFLFERSGSSALLDRATWAKKTLLLRESGRPTQCYDAIRASGKVAILATHHTSNSFLLYHRGLVDALVESGFVVLIVHAAGRDIVPELFAIESRDTFLYVKRNLGYDFGSWLFGYMLLRDMLDDTEEIIFINDSILGPLFSFRPVYESIKQMGVDVVGMTDSYERTYHLQSYFYWFGPEVCHSSALSHFCFTYPFDVGREAAITEGELYLTKMLQDSGFRVNSLFPYEQVAGQWLAASRTLAESICGLPDAGINLDDGPASYKRQMLEQLNSIIGAVVTGRPLNPTLYFWDTLIEHFGFPFLKRELAATNSCEVPSYFRIAEMVDRWPVLGSQIIEMRQRCGGAATPFFAPNRRSNG